MISEVNFSRGYSFFWTEHTPWINDYVSSINKGLVERIYLPIDITDDTIHRSINNVVAFTLFKNIVTKCGNGIDIAMEEAKSIMMHYPRNSLESYTLTKEYQQIIKLQSDRLTEQYSNLKVKFYPEFPGCGIMESCQGDLYYNKTLVEVKAGDRGFLSSDIKQLIVYCALNWLSNKPINIENVELFNPRQGLYWNSGITDMILSISNVPMEDLFDQIGKYLSSMSEEIELL